MQCTLLAVWYCSIFIFFYSFPSKYLSLLGILILLVSFSSGHLYLLSIFIFLVSFFSSFLLLLSDRYGFGQMTVWWLVLLMMMVRLVLAVWYGICKMGFFLSSYLSLLLIFAFLVSLSSYDLFLRRIFLFFISVSSNSSFPLLLSDRYGLGQMTV